MAGGDAFWFPLKTGDLADLDDLWQQPTEPSLPVEGDIWFDTFLRRWLYREDSQWLEVGASSAPSAVGRIIPVGVSIASATVSASSVDVVIDSPFGIDATGDPYYDSAGAVAGEEAFLILDRSTGTYSVIPWTGDDLDVGAGTSSTIADPVLAAPDYVTRTVLTTPTYDGSGQTVHPDVVKVPGGWNGWLYWMAVTPYPAGDDTLENPSILVSNDGTTWQVPDGLTNPVIPAPVAPAYNSDPNIVIDGTTAWLFYRESKSGTGSYDRLYVTSSTDGVTWAAPSQILSGVFAEMLSPSVIKEADDTWKMWTVNMTASPNTLQLRTATSPTGSWSAPTTCSAAVAGDRDLWHIDVIRDGDTLRAIINTTTLDTASAGTDGRILLASSADGTTWTLGADHLTPSGSGWDGQSIYRGTALFEQNRWRLWYGGVSSANEWRTGYTEINPTAFP